MSSPPQAPERRANDDAPLPLPPLDDDGETVGAEADADASFISQTSERDSLDDSTGESEPLEGISFETTASESGLLEDTEAQEGDYDGSDLLVSGAEDGLLHESDEGDGRDVRPDEAGMLQGDEHGSFDDGGAEGTGEDPALGIDQGDPAERLSLDRNPDDDSIDDAWLEDADQARVRDSLEREPWPPRADVSWNVDVVNDLDEPAASLPDRSRAYRGMRALPLGAGATVIAAGPIVAAFESGAGLFVSCDGGERFERVSGCGSTTASVVVPGGASGGIVLAALYDATRDASALARVRLAHGSVVVSEIVADLASGEGAVLGDDPGPSEEEMARVDVLTARARLDGGIEAIAFGRFGARRAKG